MFSSSPAWICAAAALSILFDKFFSLLNANFFLKDEA